MIKFFRYIRQRMIKENRVSKYLLYAIGEIVLVVIGILIALQINTWNESRKDRFEEQQLLVNLKQEFTKNLTELHFDHDINVNMLESAYYFLESDLQSQSGQHIDSLLGQMSNFATFDPSIGYMEQAISANKLDLIQSDTLKRTLSQWTGELNDLTEDNIIRREHWLNHFLPIVRRYIPARNGDGGLNRPDYIRDKKVSLKQFSEADHLAFITSMEVDGIVYDHYLNQYYVLINEEGIRAYIERVLELIEKELNKVQ